MTLQTELDSNIYRTYKYMATEPGKNTAKLGLHNIYVQVDLNRFAIDIKLVLTKFAKKACEVETAFYECEQNHKCSLIENVLRH